MSEQPPTPPRPTAAAAAAEIRQLPPARVLLVALDIGKDVNVAFFRTASGHVVLPPTKIATLASGLARFTAELDRHLASGAFDLVVLGHEPTGIYHEAWGAQLLEHYRPYGSTQAAPLLRYRLLHPTLVKTERQTTSHRPRKSDALDVRAIASLLERGLGAPVHPPSATERHLRLRLAHLRRLARQQRRLALDLLRTLDRLWPGALGQTHGYTRSHPDLPPLVHLVASRPLERQRLRVLLDHAPNPYTLRTLGVAGLRALFHAHHVRCGPATAEHILAVVEQSLLPPPAVAADLATLVQADFALYRSYEQRLADEEAQLVALLPQSSGQVLLSFPGLSPLLAVRYLAALGDVARFPSAAHLWSFAGFDPSLDSSGNRTRRYSISQRGSPYLRDTLFQIGHLAAQHCPDAIRLMAACRKRGMSSVPATIHVAHKVNRVLFRLLVSQQPYRSPLTPAQDQEWLAYAVAHRQRA